MIDPIRISLVVFIALAIFFSGYFARAFADLPTYIKSTIFSPSPVGTVSNSDVDVVYLENGYRVNHLDTSDYLYSVYDKQETLITFDADCSPAVVVSENYRDCDDFTTQFFAYSKQRFPNSACFYTYYYPLDSPSIGHSLVSCVVSEREVIFYDPMICQEVDINAREVNLFG